MRILVVDDDVLVRDWALKALGDHEVSLAENLREAREHLDRAYYDLILCDFRLGAERGTELLGSLYRDNVDFGRFALMSGDDRRTIEQHLVVQVPILEKPFGFEEILALLEKPSFGAGLPRATTASLKVVQALVFAGLLGALPSACSTPDTITDLDANDELVYGLCDGDGDDVARPASWTTESHCVGAAPDYDKLFDSTVVHRIDITISAADHRAQLDDLDDLLGGQGMGPPTDSDEDPIWVPATVTYDGLTWTEVGIRYKGNSSLHSAYRAGIDKLAFRLTFDKYEDEHPELDDQRFFGFKKMTFSNGFNDPSLIRDKIAADIFRDGGVPAARGAFARIYFDVGDGPTYAGLYTMIEDPSNRMLDSQFADDSGNLYKPESTWSTFIEADFDKKTNELEADFTDVTSAVAALNGDRTDAAAWRAGLEATFDVDRFLRVLALNQAMVNWDSYGWMAHNYYLYADPLLGGRLVWIPWDLNEALLYRGDGGMFAGSTSLTLDEVGGQWPLIRYLLDDPVYSAQYRDELAAARTGSFDESTVVARMHAYHDLIAPYVVGDSGEQAPYTFLTSDAQFTTSLVGGATALETHVEDRHAALAALLD